MSTMTNFSRAGAAAFALGLFLVGPQAAGIAAAEDGGEGSSAAAAGASSRSGPSEARAGRGSGGRPASAGRAVRGGGVPRSAGVGASREQVVAGPAAAAPAPARPARPARAARPAWTGASSAPVVDVEAGSRAPAVSSSTAVSGAPMVRAAFAAPAEAGAAVAAVGSVASPAALAPVASPVARAAVVSAPKWAAAPVLNELNYSVDVFLHRVGNWLANLPGGPVTTYLEGALLMVRRTLFNQAPQVNPVQETVTSVGLVTGSLGAVDAEADALSYAVVQGPQFGEAVVDEFGNYEYSPGEGYAGADSFVVRVGSDQAGVNLFDLGGDGSTLVTVLVGEGAPTNPFMDAAPDPIDATLYLADTAATVTVERQDGLRGLLGGFAASVTLYGVSADTPLVWMDAEGRNGEFSVGQILAEAGPASWWDEFAEAAELSGDGVRMGVDFTGEDGVEYTLILSKVVTGVDAAGQYVLSGVLAPNPEEQADIDQWDVLGSAYKDSYENFLAAYVKGDQPVTLAVGRADVFVDTYSPVTYANQLVGADLGVPAESMGFGIPQPAEGIKQGSVAASPVTAMMPFGDGDFIVGRADGSVSLRTNGQWTRLHDTSWDSPVQTMIRYGDGVVVGLGNGSIQQWTGTEWKELHGWQALGAPGQSTDYDRYGSNGFDIVNKTGTPLVFTGLGEGSDLPQKIGIAEGTVIGAGQKIHIEVPRGFVYSDTVVTNWAVRNWSGSADTGAGTWSVKLVSAGLATSVNHTAFCSGECSREGIFQDTINLLDKSGKAFFQTMLPYGDGFVVGLYDGSVQQWTGSGWTELKDTGWGSPVKSAMAFGDGFVVGLGNGSVQQWTGSAWNELKCGYCGDAGFNSTANTVLTYKDGLVVGLSNGSVQQWTGSGWQELQGNGWGSGVNALLPFGDGFVVGLSNGSVQQWTGSGWQELQGNGWASGVNALLPFEDGFVVGLDNSSVQQWTGAGFVELQGMDWRTSTIAMTPRSDFVVEADDASVEVRHRFVVGLADGSVQQWTGTNWQELSPKKIEVLEPADFQKAIEYAFNGGDPTAADAPIFSKKEFRPACGSSCDGTIYPFQLISDEPYQLASKTFNLGANGQTLDLSFDVQHAVFGYAYVPAGVWGKMRLGDYAGGFLLALPVGPSAKLNLNGSTTFSTGDIELLSKEYVQLTPAGVFSLGADVTAKVDVTLDLPEDFTKDALSAHAYFVPGMLITYNTKAFQGLQFGIDSYLDVDFSDFQQIQGVTIVPSLTPVVTGTYGLFTPEKTPIIGKKTIASVELVYTNPVDLTLELKKNTDPSLTFHSSGNLTYEAGILQVLTSSLSFNDDLDIYSYTSGNLWKSATSPGKPITV